MATRSQTYFQVLTIYVVFSVRLVLYYLHYVITIYSTVYLQGSVHFAVKNAVDL